MNQRAPAEIREGGIIRQQRAGTPREKNGGKRGARKAKNNNTNNFDYNNNSAGSYSNTNNSNSSSVEESATGEPNRFVRHSLAQLVPKNLMTPSESNVGEWASDNESFISLTRQAAVIDNANINNSNNHFSTITSTTANHAPNNYNNNTTTRLSASDSAAAAAILRASSSGNKPSKKAARSLSTPASVLQESVASTSKLKQIGQLLDRVECCLQLKDRCQRMSVELGFLAKELEEFNKLVDNCDLNDNRDFCELSKALEEKCQQFEGKMRELSELKKSIQPFESSSYNDAILFYNKIDAQWKNIRLNFSQEYANPSQKTQILTKCKKKFGEIECFVSKNESLLKHIEKSDCKNPETNEEFESSIKKMKEKIKAYESEIETLKNTIGSFEAFSNQKIASNFESCTKTLENFKHEIIHQENSLSLANIGIRQYNSIAKCRNSLDLIKKQLSEADLPNAASKIEESLQTVNYLEEIYHSCHEFIDEVKLSEDFSNEKPEIQNAIGGIDNLMEEVSEQLKIKKSDLQDSIVCQKYIEELKTFKQSIEGLMKSNIKSDNDTENIVETESEARKLAIFQTEIKKRIEEMQPTLKTLHEITSEEQKLPIFGALKTELEIFERFVDESEDFVTNSRKDLMVKIDYHKYISQSNILLQNLKRISGFLDQVKADKMFKDHQGYKIYFSSLKDIQTFYQSKYDNLKEICKSIKENDSDVKINDAVNDQQQLADAEFEKFITKSSNAMKFLDSIDGYTDFLRDFNYLKHNLGIKNQVGEWMLKCSDDDIAYYYKKSTEDFETVKHKVDLLKEKYEKYKPDEFFNGIAGIDMKEIDDEIEKLRSKHTLASTSFQNSNKDLNFIVELDFLGLWMDAVEDAITSLNPKLVSYSWQLSTEVAKSELDNIKSRFTDLESRLMSDYKEIPEDVFAKLLIVKDKIKSGEKILDESPGKDTYAFFLKLKNLKFSLKAFLIQFSIPKSTSYDEIMYCKSLLSYLIGQYEEYNKIFVDLIGQYQSFANSGGHLASLLSIEIEDIIRDHHKINGYLEYVSSLCDEFKCFFEKKHIFDDLNAQIKALGMKVDQKEQFSKGGSLKEHLLLREKQEMQNIESQLLKVSESLKSLTGTLPNLFVFPQNDDDPSQGNFNLSSACDELKQSISEMMQSVTNINSKMDDSLQDLKILKNLKVIHQWLHLNINSELLKGIPTDANEFNAFQKELSQFTMEVHEKQQAFEYNKASLFKYSTSQGIIDDCQRLFDKINSEIEIIFKSTGPSHHLAEILSNINHLSSWIESFHSRLDDDDLTNDEVKLEFELLNNSLSHLKSVSNKLLVESSDDLTINSLKRDVESSLANVAQLKRDLEVKANLKHSQNEIDMIETKVKDLVIFCDRDVNNLDNLLGSPITSQTNQIDDQVHVMSVLSSLDADLKKAADIENNIKAAEYNLHNDQPLINSLKAKVSEQKERINAHKDAAQRRIVEMKHMSKVRLIMKELSDASCWVDEALNQISSTNNNNNSTTQNDFNEMFDNICSIKYKKMNELCKKAESMKHDIPEPIRDELSKKVSEIESKCTDLVSKQDFLNKTVKKSNDNKEKLHDLIEVEQFLSAQIEKASEKKAENLAEGLKDQMIKVQDQKHFINETIKYIDKLEQELNQNTSDTTQEASNSEDSDSTTDSRSTKSSLKKVTVNNIKMKLEVFSNQANESELKLADEIQTQNENSSCFKIQFAINRIASNLASIDKIDNSQKGRMKKKSLLKFTEDELNYAQELLENLQDKSLDEKLSTVRAQLESKKAQICLCDQIRTKVESSEMFIDWLDEKLSQMQSSLVRDPKTDQAFNFAAAKDTFKHFEPEIEDILTTLPNLLPEVPDKKLVKLANEKSRKLNQLMQNFQRVSSDVDSANRFDKNITNLDKCILDSKRYKDLITDYMSGIVSGSDFSDHFNTSVGVSRLSTFKTLLESKHSKLKEEFNQFNDELKDRICPKVHKSRYESVLDSYKNIDSAFENAINRCNYNLAKWKYQNDCSEMREKLKAVNEKLSTTYAHFLNSFANMQQIEHPHEKLAELKVSFQPIIMYAKNFLENDMHEFREQEKLLSTQHSIKKTSDLVNVEKNLRNLLNCYIKDYENLIERLQKSSSNLHDMSSSERTYIKMSSEFSSIIDSIDLLLNSPIKIMTFDSLKYYYNLKKSAHKQLKDAEKLLDTLSSLFYTLGNSPSQVVSPLKYKELEDQFLDVEKCYFDFSTNLETMHSELKKLYTLQKFYTDSSLNLNIELDLFYNEIVKIISESNFDANILKQINDIIKNLSNMDTQVETIKTHWANVMNKYSFITSSENVSENIILNIPSKLALNVMLSKYNHMCVLASEVQKNIKSLQKDVCNDELLVKEATLVFLVLDKENSGYLNYENIKNCLETLGFILNDTTQNDNSPQVQSSLFTLMVKEMDPGKSGKIYLKSFLNCIKKHRSAYMKDSNDVIETFRGISANKDYVTKSELIENLGDDLADFWMKKFDECAKVNKGIVNDQGYNFNEFFTNCAIQT